MNKYQKLIAQITQYSMKIDAYEGICDTSFRFNRKCWRAEIKSFKNNYKAIKSRRDYLRDWNELNKMGYRSDLQHE